MTYSHVRTYTDERLSQLVRSHGRGGDGEIDVAFLAAVSAEAVRRGINRIATRSPASEPDDSYPPPCSNPGGHEWPRVEEHERCLCIHCGADGDA